jgi:fatty-acid desaturase
VKIYNAIGYATLLLYGLACVQFAPAAYGPWLGLLIGTVYITACWALAGIYLSCVIHMGIAHRALEYRPWFIKGITLLNNALGVYVNPITWVNRHRLHHTYADHAGDPNKLASDGFWRTLYLCLFPYKTHVDVAKDPILKTWPFRLVAHPVFVLVAQGGNFLLLAWWLGDVRFAAVLWVGLRVFALWVNMVQNYWTHDRRFGYRRYAEDEDNAMNIGEWLPVTATFSACLQNNHHHSPGLLRLSHDESEYDFGFMAVKAMKALGLVTATATGQQLPKDVPLRALEF